MARALADMTPEERQSCVGMWCDNLASTAKEPTPVVLACVQGEQCWILHTDLHGEWSCFSLGSVSPRFDLSRAWLPDGTPVPATERLEYGVTAVIGGRRLIMSNTRHGNTMDGMGRWFPMKELAEDFMRTVTATEPQLVCRRASTYWEGE